MTGPEGRSAGSAPAVSVCLHSSSPYRIETLRKRADFLRAASARRQGTAGFLLQARRRHSDEPVAPDVVRIGFTCSKKLGNAVARNRAKRRLRALARAVMPTHACPGWDYVLVGRPQATAERDFTALIADLEHALPEVHSDRPRKPRPDNAASAKGRRRGRG